MVELIGKKAYKKSGFHSGLVGTVIESNNRIWPYMLDVKGVGVVPFMDNEEIDLLDDKSDSRKKMVTDSYNEVVARNGESLRRLGEE